MPLPPARSRPAPAAAITDRVDRYLARVNRDASAAERARLQAATVVLDPPRAGAGRAGPLLPRADEGL
ncbi:hypothetical protein GY24_05045, partial [Microterricola pindariensis]